LKLAFIDDFVPAVVRDGRAVDIRPAVRHLRQATPQLLMVDIIAHFAELRPELERLSASGGRSLAEVRLRPPLPSPEKILCAMGGYMEGVENGVRKGIDMFLKASSAVIGHGDTVVLPEVKCPIFHHEAELGLVIGSAARSVGGTEARAAIFGYVNFMDVSARGFPLEPSMVSVPGFIGKSFDTFAPLGPWITTADEVSDVGRLRIRLWVNEQLRQDYSTADAEYPVERLVSFAASIMTLQPGDLIACGTNHQGLGPVQDGDLAEMEVEGLGRLAVGVRDPLKRTWPREIDRAFAERVRSRRLPEKG
jgi:2-keto-4-pentenoate hydratase/2-oxohepta-3-ene-1,7-dioic acid hydratase in catechol pathway